MTKEEKINKIIELALGLEGVPYKYGAKMSDAPDFFDCSGFIKYIFEQVGYEIPRSTIEQAEFAGEIVDNIDNLEIGDLIFLHGTKGHYNKKFPEGIGHVVMYIGDNKVIHALSKERVQEYPNPIVEEGSVVVEDMSSAVDSRKPIVVIKRIIKD